MFHQGRKALAGVATLGVLAIGGTAIASAATSSSSTSSSTTAPGTHMPRSNMPAPGSASHEGAEKAVTGTAAAQAQAAAVKAEGGGTAGAVTTDFTGNGYEVTVTKSDGSKVEVHLDSSFNVLKGGPGCHGGTPGAAPSGTSSSSYGPMMPAGAPSGGYGA